MTGLRLATACKPGEIGEHGSDQLLSTRVLRGSRGGKQIQQVASFVGSFLPIRRRRRQQLRFQFLLPETEYFLVSLNVSEKSAELGGLLGGHAAMLIQIDCLV